MFLSRLVCHVASALVVLVGTSFSVRAQVPLPGSVPPGTLQLGSVRDPQAVSLLAASLAALGRTPPTDSSATGTVEVISGTETQNGTINLLSLGTNQTIEDIELPGSAQKISVFGPVAANDSGGSQKLIPNQTETPNMAVYLPLPLLAGALSNFDFSFQYVAQEVLDGSSVNHIRMWSTFASKPPMQRLSRFSVRDIWLDASTNLPKKIGFNQLSANGSPLTVVGIELSQYRNFNGMLYPTLIQKSLNGTPWMTISITSFNFNTGLSLTQFLITCSN